MASVESVMSEIIERTEEREERGEREEGGLKHSETVESVISLCDYSQDEEDVYDSDFDQ